MYDTIELIEPLPCFSCFSTIDTDVGRNEELSEIELGDEKLKLLRMHDGKGGIKNFQTKDLHCLMCCYYFPGFISHNRTSAWFGEYEVALGNIEKISISERCNNCNGFWHGNLYLKYEKNDDISLTEFIELETNETIFLREGDDKNEFYSIEYNDRTIRIFPKLPAAMRWYNKSNEEFKIKAENYRTFLDTINVEHKAKIINYLEDKLAKIGKNRVAYSNDLARAVEDYDKEKEKNLYSRSALETAFIILYGRNKDESVLELVSISGLTTQEKFLKDFPIYEWFFLSDKELEEYKYGHMSVVGIFGGANHFLNKIKLLK